MWTHCAFHYLEYNIYSHCIQSIQLQKLGTVDTEVIAVMLMTSARLWFGVHKFFLPVTI